MTINRDTIILGDSLKELKKIPNETFDCIFADPRHKPQANDLEFMTYMGYHEIPFSIVFTKADKLSKRQLDKNITDYKNELLKTWEELPSIFITSSGTKLGRDEILGFIDQVVKPVKK